MRVEVRGDGLGEEMSRLYVMLDVLVGLVL